MLVENLEAHRVQMAAAGDDHTVVLTFEGIVLTWGAGDHGQLGLGGQDDTHVPEQIDADRLMDGAKISVVACRNARTAMLTTNGVLYTCGRFISVADTGLAAGDVVNAHEQVHLTLVRGCEGCLLFLPFFFQCRQQHSVAVFNLFLIPW